MGLRDRRSPRLTEPVTANRQFGFRVYQGDLARTLVALSLSLCSLGLHLHSAGQLACLSVCRDRSVTVLSGFTLLWLS